MARQEGAAARETGRPFFTSTPMPPVCAGYIDGFNLEYGLPDRPIGGKEGRWLNPVELLRRAAPVRDLRFVKYFTAPLVVNELSKRRGDLNQSARQAEYWRALKTLPNLEVILGHFRVDKKSMPLANLSGPLKYAMVWKTEEKGSDVNLAAHLVWDAARGAFDRAVVVSNDSDLAEAIHIATREIGREVYVLSPPRHRATVKALCDAATESRVIRPQLIRRAQFPPSIPDGAGGTITKPAEW